MELGRQLTSCLFTLFSEVSLGPQASMQTLMEVEKDVMTYLVDERLLKLEEAPQLIRTFNCLVLKICENANKTAVFRYVYVCMCMYVHLCVLVCMYVPYSHINRPPPPISAVGA